MFDLCIANRLLDLVCFHICFVLDPICQKGPNNHAITHQGTCKNGREEDEESHKQKHVFLTCNNMQIHCTVVSDITAWVPENNPRSDENGAEGMPKATKIDPKGCENEARDLPKHPLGNRVEKVRKM